jgi:hypothetical protein
VLALDQVPGFFKVLFFLTSKKCLLVMTRVFFAFVVFFSGT